MRGARGARRGGARRRGRDAQAGHHLAGRDLVRRRLRAGVAVDDQVPPLRAAGDPRAGDRRSAASSTTCSSAAAARAPAAVALVGLPLLALVTRRSGRRRKNAAQHFLWLFSYDYVHNKSGRPWPDRLDFRAPLIGFASLFAVATVGAGGAARPALGGASALSAGRGRVHLLPARRLHARRRAVLVAEGADRDLLPRSAARPTSG